LRAARQIGPCGRNLATSSPQRVERAFENGSEHRQSAAMNGPHASRPR